MRNNPCVTISVNSMALFDRYEETFRLCGKNFAPPFVEILWDNYCHIAPKQLRDWLQRFAPRVALHIMHSRYLYCSDEKFCNYLRLLTEHVRVLNPLYVSDHVANFRMSGVHLLTPAEYDYELTPRLIERLHRYQEAIGQPLLLENYASTDAAGARQVDFFAEVMGRVGCDILFDISNAAIAEANKVLSAQAWTSLLSDRLLHCHIGGYSLGSTTGLLHDSHNAPISALSSRVLRETCTVADVQSVCLERDYNFEEVSVAEDINLIASIVQEMA